MPERSPLTELEKSIAAKVVSASIPPGTASKRFARDLGAGYVKELSCKGRKFLAFVAHRYRRQYQLTSAELDWIAEWLTYEEWSEPPAASVTAITAEPDTRQMTLEEVYGVIDVA